MADDGAETAAEQQPSPPELEVTAAALNRHESPVECRGCLADEAATNGDGELVGGSRERAGAPTGVNRQRTPEEEKDGAAATRRELDGDGGRRSGCRHTREDEGRKATPFPRSVISSGEKEFGRKLDEERKREGESSPEQRDEGGG